MAKYLVVVESPTKVRTIRRYLGDRYAVLATMGHVKDLPTSKLGVDVENGFEPVYLAIRGKKALAQIRQAARGAETVFLAPDPDREGEAIAWHVAEELEGLGVPIRRVLFHEITRKGIEAGLAQPRDIDGRRYDSHRARRVLDRLVGYELSPVLWKKVQRGLSAGRVQSVALRLIVERERAIREFRPEEYWHLFAALAAETGEREPFRAQLTRIGGEPARVKTGDQAAALRERIESAALAVAAVEEKTRRRRPPPPYITSRLQQDASSRFRFSAKRTMQAAQKLYEGVDIGNGGPTGLITYMRTDSTRVSEGALEACREYIRGVFGPGALPDRPNRFASRAGAQDAHEAIRPADVALTPELAAKHLPPELAKLYGLIWRRFVASQMNPAVYAVTSVEVEARPADAAADPLRLRATCSRLADPGWLAVAGDFSAPEGSGAKEGREDDDAPPRAVPAAPERGADPDETGCRAASLPRLERGQPLRLVPPGVESEQKFTQPPARFSEGTLVREMEELGIGRPSTYAATVSTLLQRRYVRKTENRLPPTELGEIVIDRLLLHFPTIMDAGFTARMEEDLDRVESDQADWRKILAAFYVPFHADVDRAMREMKDVRREQQKTDETCEKCGAPLVKRWGRAGWFLACTAYPKCDFTKDVPGSDPATAAPPLPEVHGETCHLCGKPMRARRGRFGPFLACTGYPKCKGTRPLPTGVVCPKPGCGGRIVERRSRAGRNFWECENRKRIPRGKSAPKADAPPAPAEDRGCDFVLWKKPIPSPCPRCGSKYLVEMKSKGTVLAACPDETCGWRGPVPGADASAAGEQRPEE